jgi:RNA polymerase sigma-70 factor (sigma-E family)
LDPIEDAVDELWPVAYRVAYRVLGNREDAEDVAQDALIVVGLRWKKVRAYAPAFTARVAGQRAIDVWRRRSRSPVPEMAGHLDDPAPSIGERDELVAALRRLPTRQREVVILRYLADVSENDTALALGCSPGTVKQHASRGLNALRSRLPVPGEVD